MGRDLYFVTDSFEKVEQSKQSDPARIAQILQLTKELAPSDLKLLFENMFKIMTTSAKEAVNELMYVLLM